MTKRAVGWVAVAVLAVGMIALWGAFTMNLGWHGRGLALQLESERQRNFAELVHNVQNIQGLLGKGMVAGSVQQNMLYMGEVNRRASLANMNFMALPLPGPLSAGAGKFLSQVGDFAYSVARSEAAGRPMTAAQRQELGRLQANSTALAAELQTVGARAATDSFRWVVPAPRFSDLFTAAGWRRLRLGKPEQSQPPKSLIPAGLEAVGPQMDRLPVLVYDGPFADQRMSRAPALSGAAVSADAALTRALAVLPMSSEYRLVQTVERKGVPEAFSFRLTPAGATDGPAVVAGPRTRGARTAGGPNYSVVVDIAKAGGHLVSFVNARLPGAARLTLAQARDIGRDYLNRQGYSDMVATYGEAVDGIATIQYASRVRGVLIYPDQVKVRIALDTGEVTGVDARSYVMAHRDRGAQVPAVTRAEAARALNPDLQVSRVQLALIPTEVGDSEVLAYEFLGTLGNQTYLVYVNAKTGLEERILQLLTTGNGTLAL